jgi:hypothetical protein
MKKLIFIFLAFFIISCSPQKRLARLIKKYPELSLNDTIIYRDTFYTKNIYADTIISFYNYIDTVYIKKEKLEIKILPIKDNTIYVSGNCLPDTFYIEKKIPIQKIKVVEKKENFWKSIFLAQMALFFLIIILSIIFKIK